jgi:septum formation protein
LALILASSSAIRRHMLDAAGVEYEAIPSAVDESGIKGRIKDPDEIAAKLAAAKAEDVSAGRPGDWVIGSDSVVSVNGRPFDKPRDRDEAAKHLRFFSGKSMTLSSAVVLAREGEVYWCRIDRAALQVRALSDDFIEQYLDVEWPDVGYCVGVFRLEGRGVQLFDEIEGNYFTILGMPLIPLLVELRELGFLPA